MSLDFSKVAIERIDVVSVFGPVVQCGEFLVQAAKVDVDFDNDLSTEAHVELHLGDMLLSRKFSPPKDLGIDASSVAISSWLGGRIRHLFFDAAIEDENMKSDGETLLDVDFVCCLADETSAGWGFCYRDTNMYPALWFGSVDAPSVPDKVRKRLTKALFDKLTESPAEVTDFDDKHDYGTFGVKDGVPFFN